MEIKIPTNREPCFDGLARLSENLVVIKCVEEGEIYAFDFGQVSSIQLPLHKICNLCSEWVYVSMVACIKNYKSEK